MIGALLEASGYERYVISHWGGKQNKVFQKKTNRAKNSVVFFYDRAVLHASTKIMSVYGIKIGHGEHTSCLMASKTILCQAVLTAKGGLKWCPLYAICGFYIHLTYKYIIYGHSIWLSCL